MNGELGTIILTIAFCLALVQAIFPLWVARKSHAHFVSLARSAAYGQFLFIASAFGLLIYVFIVNDFSLSYVATNSNTKLPTIYRISAVWGAHEGSLLLWVLCLNLWTIAVCLFSKNLPEQYTARIIAVMGVISAGFLLFILVTSNPFAPLYYDTFRFGPEFFSKLKIVIANANDPELMTILGKYDLNVAKPIAGKFYTGGSSGALQDLLARYQLDSEYSVRKFYFAAREGRDLNPLLQDPGLIFHPPLLYMGYVGFSVAFSFAIAALIGGKLDSAWARWSRPWTTIAWVFLTLGITLGSWWAYYELGWGGWWFWDPVENASFMPWLVGTALIHSLAVTEKRGTFQTWTVFLAIFAFALSLLGTFLVRSGVLDSVHSFSADPSRGVFLLTYFAIVIGGSLALYAKQAPNIKSTGTFDDVSREGALMLNNIILVVAAATVLIGTLYPIISRELFNKDISIGAPWFNWFFVKLMLPLAFLAGLGPLMKWKRQQASQTIKQTAGYFFVSLFIGMAYWLFVDRKDWMIAVCIAIAIWLVLTNAELILYRARKMKSFPKAIKSISRSSAGMMLAHLGLAVFIIGAAFAGVKTVKESIKIKPGGSHTLQDYKFKLVSVRWHQGHNFNAYEGQFYVFKNGKQVSILTSQKRYYRSQSRGSRQTEAGIDGGVTRDLFVSMGNPLNNYVHNYLSAHPNGLNEKQKKTINQALARTAWVVVIQHKPFIRWIWFGTLLMALGGLLAALDKRYRLKKKKPGANTNLNASTTS